MDSMHHCAICGGPPRFMLSKNPWAQDDAKDDFKLFSCKRIKCFEAVLYCATVVSGYVPVVAFASETSDSEDE